MFSEKYLERTNRLIDVQLAERKKQIPIEISTVQRQASANGMLNSSMYVLQVKDICEREIEIRAVIVWKSLVRIINTLTDEANDNLASDLKQYLSSSINSNYDELTQILNQNLKGMLKPEQVAMTEVREHVIAKHEIEIDLYVDTKAESTQTESASMTEKHDYHFYGAVGAVQTGASAQASVVQNLGAEDKEVIKQALTLASDAIQAATNIVDTQKNELIEIVNDANTELDKGSPNSTKLQSLFITIGTTIQTLASAKPAYQALKGALIPLGITLP